MNRYYSLYEEDNKASLYIYGDITSFPWMESDVSNYSLSKELQDLDDVEEIDVYINSYGGEVAEGLAIYSSLKRHKAKVRTFVEGFACSIASVIFMAGDERVVTDTSMLMIHNAWSYARGDSNEFKKQAKDLEKITQSSINAYMSRVNIEEDELKELLNDETWLAADEAIEMGFANKLVEEEGKQVATQSIRQSIAGMINDKPAGSETNGTQFSTKDMKAIIKEEMKALEERMDVVVGRFEESIGKFPEVEKTIEENNKPLEMLKALFNEED